MVNMNGTKSIFTRRVNELMEQTSYTQKQVAELAGITEAAFSRYMNSQRVPKPAILANIANILHTTTDYLLGMDDRYNDFGEMKSLVAMKAGGLTNEQRRELSDILLNYINK